MCAGPAQEHVKRWHAGDRVQQHSPWILSLVYLDFSVYFALVSFDWCPYRIDETGGGGQETIFFGVSPAISCATSTPSTTLTT